MKNRTIKKLSEDLKNKQENIEVFKNKDVIPELINSLDKMLEAEKEICALGFNIDVFLNSRTPITHYIEINKRKDPVFISNQLSNIIKDLEDSNSVQISNEGGLIKFDIY